MWLTALILAVVLVFVGLIVWEIVSPIDLEYQCPTCFGKGYLPTQDEVCPTCHGEKFLKW